VKFVIDTNILISSLSSKSKYHWIIKDLINNKFEMLIANYILTGYEEKLKLKYGDFITTPFFELLLNLENVNHLNIYFNWNLIFADESDNKFVDCYVAGNADYIVTEDRHFDILKQIEFPNIKTIGINEFKNLFNSF
jgi:putative PIN family toxin of toxin-antitoxin system